MNQKFAKGVDLTGMHILLCEDHPINQKVVQSILKKVNARVTTASNGLDGYETFIKSTAGTFDLILMDIQMPKLNGYEAAKAIRESEHPEAKSIPIIALSANAFADDIQRSIDVGMNEHLAKPVMPQKLYQSILRLGMKQNKPKGAKLKVLFVDDAEINITVLTLAINDEYDIFVARNGEEAVRVLESTPDMAAMITDIMMPGIDGKELIRTVRADKRYETLAIIANTQYGDSVQEEAILALGADDFLYKPTSPILIRNRLKSVLRKYDK